VAAVLYSRCEVFEGGPVASEFVRDNNSRLAKRLKELAKKPSCGLFVTLRLDQDVQDIAFAVNSTPQPILLPVNWKDNFV